MGDSLKGKMKAVRFYEPKKILFEEVSIPQIKSDEILVKVKVALTCGTDVKMYKRGHPKVRPPLTIGHEFAGNVFEIGEKIRGKFKFGQRVAIANSAPCNTCYFCKIGKPNLCVNLLDVLIGFSVDGAFAEYIRIPSAFVQHNTYAIPDFVSFEEAAFLEPLACAVNGNHSIDMNLGDTVVVIGSGPLGLLHLQLTKNRGASKIIITDLNEKRLKIAGELGADVMINASKEDQLNRVMELTGGLGADVVIEAVGSPQTWEAAVKMTRAGGKTLFFGGCPFGSKVTLDASKIHYEDLTLKGVFHHTPLSVYQAQKLISNGKLCLKPLITDECSLSEVENALKKMAKGESLKIAIKP
jgi:L-iditol 2-dehydrogenase